MTSLHERILNLAKLCGFEERENDDSDTAEWARKSNFQSIKNYTLVSRKIQNEAEKTSFPKNHNFLLDIKKEAETIFFSRPPYNVKIEEMSNCHQWNVNALLNDSTSPYLIIPNPFPIFLRVKQFSCQLWKWQKRKCQSCF